MWHLWEQIGFACFDDGGFWLVNPDDYVDLLDEILKPTPFYAHDDWYVLGRTAFRDLEVMGRHTKSSLTIDPDYIRIFRTIEDNRQLTQRQHTINIVVEVNGTIREYKGEKSYDLTDIHDDPSLIAVLPVMVNSKKMRCIPLCQPRTPRQTLRLLPRFYEQKVIYLNIGDIAPIYPTPSHLSKSRSYIWYKLTDYGLSLIPKETLDQVKKVASQCSCAFKKKHSQTLQNTQLFALNVLGTWQLTTIFAY